MYFVLLGLYFLLSMHLTAQLEREVETKRGLRKMCECVCGIVLVCWCVYVSVCGCRAGLLCVCVWVFIFNFWGKIGDRLRMLFKINSSSDFILLCECV